MTTSDLLPSLQHNLIQMATSTLCIVPLLLLSLTGAQIELRDFPQNFIVTKRNESNPVTLTCGATTEEAINWKLNGEVIEGLDYYIRQSGQNLTLTEVDTPILGEYSCWKGMNKLSSIYVLQEEEEEEDSDSLLTCRAKSYDCKFSCIWNDSSRYTAVRLGLGPDCSDGGDSCQWVRPRNQNSKRGFHFELIHDLSPYTEESTMLELTAEAINKLSILRTTKRFYLRDIVQPDSPQIVRCEESMQNLNVTVDPPSSWSTPHSFFSLQHEIEYMLRDNGKTGRSSSNLIPKEISKLRVRCRDPLVFSSWSQWTSWKNVT